jgi:hypothetical protein
MVPCKLVDNNTTCKINIWKFRLIRILIYVEVSANFKLDGTMSVLFLKNNHFLCDGGTMTLSNGDQN